MSGEFAIVVENLTVVYNENSSNEIIALNNFSLKLNKGEILVITGGNGTGKSTLLNAIAGTIPIKAGKIFYDGKDITKLTALDRAKFMGIVYQDTMLGTCPNLTLNENFKITEFNKWWQLTPYRFNLTIDQIKSLKNTGLSLESRLSSKISMLSGGQRQAIAVCLAFENKKPILLFDEFTSALDEFTLSNVMNYTFAQSIRNKTTILMVMHNITHLLKYNIKIIELNHES